MSKHDDRVSLIDMLNHSREAVQILGKSTQEELQENRLLQLALTRLVEIIGEAAHRVTAATQANHPEIPWPQIIGMRNRLIHGYDVIDIEVLHATITEDIPPLIESLGQITGK